MLSGNNGNTVPPVFMNENQLQYQTNTQSNQLHLHGTMGGGGCTTVDPVNYFANDNNNLVHMARPNKRGREAESISNNNNIQRQQQLQMSLNYNHNNYNVQEEAPKENLVSTGLRLSYDDEERNSSVTSASGSIMAASPFSQSLDDSLRIHLHRQKNELDQFLKIQAAQMAKGVRDIKQRQTAYFLNAIEQGVSLKLQEKDREIESMNKKNKELVERIKQVTTEAQNWHCRAKYNESLVNALKNNLQQAMSHNNNNNNNKKVIAGADQGREGFGDSEIDDAASSYIDPNNNKKKMGNERMRCKMCNAKQVSVLLVPCRHLSLCKECDVFTGVCPVCRSLKTSSVQVFFS
ncbi:SBP (S-ribonuclease binding protein) family protein [Raphanus sativus]|uniref:BOI-related E3 ubiquitin-protein ligase 1 n=1 Tax=Raphanus sativus TaxID=3726 RepID=A0A6J0JPA2_RAPSA|nr:BOI-related E3 ubiquitin-protein ligase 1 [Raphanus sativus]XP_056862703.1 BOI-related E3 ubiquitin-protein ligase 1 [Raphanus sativus]KAJ4915498.1 SBP (S-ribonuclease binding protein) family protein [Raphanus sativus]